MIQYLKVVAAIGCVSMLGWASVRAQGGPPSAFTKTSPASGATGVSRSITLTWSASSGATSYEFCVDATNDNSCSNWVYLGPTTSRSLFNLYAGTTYYWQVRATNPGGTTYADGAAGAFASFTTGANPDPFGRVQPSDGQLGVSLNPVISWSPSSGASGYEYCYDTTNDGTCTNWIATSSGASLSGLTPNTFYYWHVRAPTPLGVTYADGSASAFWSFKTTLVLPPPACNILFLGGATGHASAASTVYPISGAPGSFTVEAWIHPSLLNGNTRYQSLVSDDGYTLLLEEFVAGALRVGVALNPDSADDFLDAAYDNRSLTLYEWHHVAFVYDHSTKEGRISVDGVLGPAIPLANVDFTASGRSLTVGGFDTTFQATGLVDNVRISSVARYAAPFTPPQSFVNDAHTRALYHFGSPLYSTVFPDESGNGHTLTAANGAYAHKAGLCLDPDAPTVTGIAPNSGPATGGTRVTVTGTKFSPGSTVSIGGSPASSFTFHSTTSISATTGARQAGLVDVVVADDLGSGTLANGFTYYTPPPAAFGKAGPSNGALGLNATVLSWGASSGATSYEYCVDTTNDNACTGWTSTALKSYAVVSGLTSQTTYYWHVRAVGAGGTSYANASPTAFWSFQTGTVTPLPDFRDFNADGKPDLVWEQASGARYIWFMDGTTLTSGAFLSPNPMNATLAIAGVNDFTGDGKPDLLMQSTGNGTVTLYHMNGVTHVASQTIQAAQNTPWKVVASGDFNADGKPDIVWQNFASGQVYIWFMSSSGGAAAYGGAGGVFAGDFIRDGASNVASVGAASMRVVGAGDIDLDGDADLVWQDQTTGVLRAWYLNGHVLTASSLFSPSAVNPAWKIKAVGDYNADGRADFIFQHTSGSLHAWFMNGATLASSASLTPAAVNPAWHLVGPR